MPRTPTFEPTADIVLDSWEFEYNNLVLGGLGDYGILTVDGLSPAHYRVDETQKMAAHGSFLFAQFLDTRTVVITGELVDPDPTSLELKVTDLTQAFMPQPYPVALRFKRPGLDTRVIYCIPSRLDFPVGFDDYNLGRVLFSTELLAEDPLLYDDVLQVIGTAPAVSNVGLGFPVGFPVGFASGASGLITLHNAGTMATLPFARIQGPATNPQLVSLSSGRAVRVNTSIGQTDYLDIDFYARTIVLNDFASRYASLDPSSEWWDLPPGDTDVEFLADAPGSTTTVSFNWRSAWT